MTEILCCSNWSPLILISADLEWSAESCIIEVILLPFNREKHGKVVYKIFMSGQGVPATGKM